MDDFDRPSITPGIKPELLDHDRLIEELQQKAQTRRLAFKLTALVCLVVIVGFGWMFRWEVVPITSATGGGHAFVLDRLSGSFYFMGGASRIEVTLEKPN